MKSKIIIMLVAILVLSGAITAFQVWESVSQDFSTRVERSKEINFTEVSELIGYAIISAERENKKLERRYEKYKAFSFVIDPEYLKEIEVDLTRAKNEIARAREKFEKVKANSGNMTYQIVYIYNTIKGVHDIHETVSRKLPFEADMADAD